jgi:hypothetical protein
MTLNFQIDEDSFNTKPVVFCGIDSYLINPKLDAKWTPNNLFFRSIILDQKGEILSCGFPKFFNYGEKKDCYPDPQNFNDWRIEEKIDGSLLICDYVNSRFNMRTRGIEDYLRQKNSIEFETLLEKYPKVESFLKKNSHLSLLFEMVTPSNVIVIKPKNVEFFLLGAVDKNFPQVVSSENLIEIWRQIGCVPAPQSFQFEGVQGLKYIAEIAREKKGAEGFVLSYNRGKNRIKLKSDWYCNIHRWKSQLKSSDSLVEYYVDNGMPEYEEFYKKIETEFDFEVANFLKDDILHLTEKGQKVKQEIIQIEEFVRSLSPIKSRKDQAEYIRKSYPKNKTSFIFSILDKKALTPVQLKKLIEQK